MEIFRNSDFGTDRLRIRPAWKRAYHGMSRGITIERLPAFVTESMVSRHVGLPFVAAWNC
jgi:hypothetical protein